jgi:hypothetical protein
MIVHLFYRIVPPLLGWAAPGKITASGGVLNIKAGQIGSAFLFASNMQISGTLQHIDKNRSV